jgi:hypothetical protein
LAKEKRTGNRRTKNSFMFFNLIFTINRRARDAGTGKRKYAEGGLMVG